MIFLKICLRPFWTHVLIITALLSVFNPGRGLTETNPAFTPYIDQFANGWIDWDSGYIYGVARAYLDANDNSPVKARMAADLMASANIVRLATGIRLDEKQTLAALSQQQATLRIEAFLRDDMVKNILVDQGKRPYFEATRVAPMRGISGLTAKLISALRELKIEGLPQETDKPEAPFTDDDEPWLVLDARKLPQTAQIHPALFPKIISEDGETLYELSQVEPGALTSRGMARYVHSEQKLSRPNKTRSDSLAASMLDSLKCLLGPQVAEAGEKQSRKKRCRYIVKEVKQATGLTQTTLMISAQDAKTVKEENRSSKILKKCRVIVVMSSPIGGIEGSIPAFLAQLDR